MICSRTPMLCSLALWLPGMDRLKRRSSTSWMCQGLRNGATRDGNRFWNYQLVDMVSLVGISSGYLRPKNHRECTRNKRCRTKFPIALVAGRTNYHWLVSPSSMAVNGSLWWLDTAWTRPNQQSTNIIHRVSMIINSGYLTAKCWMRIMTNDDSCELLLVNQWPLMMINQLSIITPLIMLWMVTNHS